MSQNGYIVRLYFCPCLCAVAVVSMSWSTDGHSLVWLNLSCPSYPCCSAVGHGCVEGYCTSIMPKYCVEWKSYDFLLYFSARKTFVI